GLRVTHRAARGVYDRVDTLQSGNQPLARGDVDRRRLGALRQARGGRLSTRHDHLVPAADETAHQHAAEHSVTAGNQDSTHAGSTTPLPRRLCKPAWPIRRGRCPGNTLRTAAYSTGNTGE